MAILDREEIIGRAVRLWGSAITVPAEADGGGYWRIGDGNGGRHVLNMAGYVVCPGLGHTNCYERQAFRMDQEHAEEKPRPKTWHWRCGWCGFIERGARTQDQAGDQLEAHNASCQPRRLFIHTVGESRLRYVLNTGDRV